MLFLAIGICALMVVAANLAVSRTKMPRTIIGILCVLSFLGHPFVSGLMLPAVIYLDLLLILAAFCGATRRREGLLSFRSISIAAAFAAVGLSGYQVWKTESGYARLREKYPLESLEGRLPLLQVSVQKLPLSPDAIGRLETFEDGNFEGYHGSFRERRLSRLHKDSVQSFIESFGTGVYRMSPFPTERNLALDESEASDLRQPGHRSVPTGSPGDWTLMAAERKPPLSRLLDQAFAEFVGPQTFGYFRDRRHVAGFMPHRVRHVPEASVDWKVQTLDLVGLLLHDDPVVYVSANLPKMDELRHGPTRPLDRFEVVGLEALRGGEDLMIAQDGEVARMVGAIRSTKQCLSCHGGERGELLGAFSYTLWPVEVGGAATKTAALR